MGNTFIPISGCSNSDYRVLIDFLIKEGFYIDDGLDHIDDTKIVAIIVNAEERTVETKSVTIMAYWSSAATNKSALDVQTFLDSYGGLVVKNDERLLDRLLEESYYQNKG